MKLGNPKNTIEVIQKYDFDFQKKFGQNFLIDERVLEKIISAAEVNKDDFVLEIGPGIGTMTQYLAERVHFECRYFESRYCKDRRREKWWETSEGCGESPILHYNPDYHGIV